MGFHGFYFRRHWPLPLPKYQGGALSPVAGMQVAKMRHLGWVNDGTEVFYAKHAEIGDGESTALKFVGLKFAIASFRRQCRDFSVDR